MEMIEPYLNAFGAMYFIFVVARLLASYGTFVADLSNDKYHKPGIVSSILGAISLIISGILFVLAFPVTLITYGICSIPFGKILRKTDLEARKEVSEIYANLERNIENFKTTYYFKGKEDGKKEGYEEGRADGWFACAENNSGSDAFDEGRKVGYNHGVEKGYEQGWSKGYDSGYKIAETHKFEEIDVSEYENNKHLGLVNSYTGEPINNQYDYVKYITRKNEK